MSEGSGVAKAREQSNRSFFDRFAGRSAVEREQLRRGTRSAEVIEHLAAPLYYRLLVGGEPPTEADADLAAAVALAAARAGVFTTD